MFWDHSSQKVRQALCQTGAATVFAGPPSLECVVNQLKQNVVLREVYIPKFLEIHRFDDPRMCMSNEDARTGHAGNAFTHGCMIRSGRSAHDPQQLSHARWDENMSAQSCLSFENASRRFNQH